MCCLRTYTMSLSHKYKYMTLQCLIGGNDRVSIEGREFTCSEEITEEQRSLEYQMVHRTDIPLLNYELDGSKSGCYLKRGSDFGSGLRDSVKVNPPYVVASPMAILLLERRNFDASVDRRVKLYRIKPVVNKYLWNPFDLHFELQEEVIQLKEWKDEYRITCAGSCLYVVWNESPLPPSLPVGTNLYVKGRWSVLREATVCDLRVKWTTVLDCLKAVGLLEKWVTTSGLQDVGPQMVGEEFDGIGTTEDGKVTWKGTAVDPSKGYLNELIKHVSDKRFLYSVFNANIRLLTNGWYQGTALVLKSFFSREEDTTFVLLHADLQGTLSVHSSTSPGHRPVVLLYDQATGCFSLVLSEPKQSWFTASAAPARAPSFNVRKMMEKMLAYNGSVVKPSGDNDPVPRELLSDLEQKYAFVTHGGDTRSLLADLKEHFGDSCHRVINVVNLLQQQVPKYFPPYIVIDFWGVLFLFAYDPRVYILHPTNFESLGKSVVFKSLTYSVVEEHRGEFLMVCIDRKELLHDKLWLVTNFRPIANESRMSYVYFEKEVQNLTEKDKKRYYWRRKDDRYLLTLQNVKQDDETLQDKTLLGLSLCEALEWVRVITRSDLNFHDFLQFYASLELHNFPAIRWLKTSARQHPEIGNDVADIMEDNFQFWTSFLTRQQLEDIKVNIRPSSFHTALCAFALYVVQCNPRIIFHLLVTTTTVDKKVEDFEKYTVYLKGKGEKHFCLNAIVTSAGQVFFEQRRDTRLLMMVDSHTVDVGQKSPPVPFSEDELYSKIEPSISKTRRRNSRKKKGNKKKGSEEEGREEEHPGGEGNEEGDPGEVAEGPPGEGEEEGKEAPPEGGVEAVPDNEEEDQGKGAPSVEVCSRSQGLVIASGVVFYTPAEMEAILRERVTKDLGVDSLAEVVVGVVS